MLNEKTDFWSVHTFSQVEVFSRNLQMETEFSIRESLQLCVFWIFAGLFT